MSADWDDLPEEVRTELERDQAATLSPEAYEARIQELKEEARVLGERIAASLARPLDHATFTGANPVPGGLPAVAHGEVVDAADAPPASIPTGGEGLIRTDAPHSAEPSPVQRRDAWLRIHRGLVREAEGELRWARNYLPHLNAPDLIQATLADEWAALQLLKHLRDMKAPEVPEDPLPGQLTIHDAVAEADPQAGVPVERRGKDAGTGVRTMLENLKGKP